MSLRSHRVIVVNRRESSWLAPSLPETGSSLLSMNKRIVASHRQHQAHHPCDPRPQNSNRSQTADHSDRTRPPVSAKKVACSKLLLLRNNNSVCWLKNKEFCLTVLGYWDLSVDRFRRFVLLVIRKQCDWSFNLIGFMLISWFFIDVDFV